MERIVEFEPAYDKRHKDPNKNYGIHGVNVRFLLKGDKGAVQFLVFTNWMLPEVQDELDKNNVLKGVDSLTLSALYRPYGADLGYHSYKPLYEGQEVLTEQCSILGGVPCYYDGSGVNAEPVMDILLREGSEGVWRELEEYYKQTFEENEE